jgi:rhomboid protease GluP
MYLPPISKPGRNLVIAVVAGLIIGFLSSQIAVNGVSIIFYLLQDNASVYESGWAWELVTSIIVVAPTLLGVIDVAFNSVAIFWLDRLFSATYTPIQYYAVFLLTGVFGNIISLLNGPNLISFGASGGIFGLLGGAVSSDYAVNRRVNQSLVWWFVIVFIFSSFTSTYVDWLAHLGGTALGLVAGYIIGRKKRESSSYYTW